MNIVLQRAEISDIQVISQLANEIWRECYLDIISIEQIDYMLQMMYSSESLKEQMELKNHSFFLINYNSEKIGFLSIHSTSPTNYWLNKFYLKTITQAKGLGTLALNALLKELKNAETMYLTCNRQNYKAINFYFKNGFVIEKTEDFDIGNGYTMNDFIFLKKINNV